MGGSRQQTSDFSKKSEVLSVRPPLSLLIVALLVLLAPLALPWIQDLWPRLLIALALAWWLPGVLLVAHWRLRDLDLTMAAVLAVAAGLCWMLLLSLIILLLVMMAPSSRTS